MAERNPPLVLQAGSHPAEHFRQLFYILSSGGEGVLGPGDLAVTQNGTPNMSVNVAAGRAVILGDEGANQGAYFVHNDATKNVAITAADGTNARIDRVVARVYDAEYSGATNAWAIEVIAGTPAGSPVAPPLPNNAITLATITVPALDTAINTAQITDQRFRAGIGGPIICTSLTRPVNPFEGMQIYETDTDTHLFYTGSVWIPKNVVYIATGSALTASATYQPVTGASLTLPAGRWLIQGRLAWATSTGTARTYNARLRNTTDSADIDVNTSGAPATTDIRPTVDLVGTLTNTTSKTVRLEGSVSAVDGTQAFSYGKIWAQSVTAIL